MVYNVNSTESPPSITDLPFRALGDGPAFDPDDLDAFLTRPHVATLSYVRRDGRPNQAPIWYEYRDGRIRINIMVGTAKYHALRREPRVSLAISDDRPPYRAVMIDGVAEFDDGPDEELSYGLAVRYFGKIGANEWWKMSAPERDGAGIVSVTIVPQEVKGFDNTTLINPVLLAFARLRHRLPIPQTWL